MRVSILSTACLALFQAGARALPAASPAEASTATTTTGVLSTSTPAVYNLSAPAVPEFPIHSSCNVTLRRQIERALDEMVELAAHARDHILRWGGDSPFVQKYFGVNGTSTEIGTAGPLGWYARVAGGDRRGMVFRCDDPDKNCATQDGWAGHWRGTNATQETVLCPPSFAAGRRRHLDSVCGLGHTVRGSPLNTFWAVDLLHRVLHVPRISEGVVDHFADGYDEVLELAKTDPEKAARDSEALQLFALEVYAFEVAAPGYMMSNGSSNNPDNEDEDEDDPIRAELITVSLLDEPAYTALSYTWGDPNAPRRRILLNGQPFKIQPNLHSALTHLRQCGIGTKTQTAPPVPHSCPGLDDDSDPALASDLRRKPLWIGAVCINQDDILERNGQVLLMGELYRNGGVVSWLGADSQQVRGLGVVRELVPLWDRSKNEAGRQVVKERAKNPSLGPSPRTMPPTPALLRGQLPMFLKATRHLWLDKDAVAGLVSVFQSDYWRRIWVVQEMMLARARSHAYMCGGEFATDGTLYGLSECIGSLFGSSVGNPLRDGIANGTVDDMDMDTWLRVRMGVYGELQVFRSLFYAGGGIAAPGWMFILYISGTRASTDPRDAVYGLLHLIEDDDDTNPIIPDYRRPVREVYIDWALRTIRQRRDLEVLRYAGRGLPPNRSKKYGNPGKTDLNLPSWVPDLYNYKADRKVDWSLHLSCSDPTHCWEGKGSVSPAISVTPEGFLVTPARRRATIATVRQAPRLRDQEPDWFGWHMVQFCFDYLASRRGQEYPTDGMPPLQALVRLVLGKLICTLRRAEADPATGKEVHRLAFGFIWWMMRTFQSISIDERLCKVETGNLDEDNTDPLKVAASNFGLGWDETFPSTYSAALFPNADVATLMGWGSLPEAVLDVTGLDGSINEYVLSWCDGAWLFVTEDGHVGRATGNVQSGDEVYEVGHCYHSLLVFRRSGDGSAEPGPKSVVLMASCEVVGLKDGLPSDEKLDGTGKEELLIR
ncbi:hypothetical protein VTJ49DRAFT_6395 [Mycothermus thermophilus]|uniref:Heterokaryon incompatibility domain-containing protein n=1 Tax=Humicola insolens TaxID=85995 RepID=A0ABR3VRL3_HUMIN